MSVNANLLTSVRDNVLKEYEQMSMHEIKGDILAEMTALNVLVTTANRDTVSLDEINTLTLAGKLIAKHYRE
jgi:hypothetical protein